MSDDDSGVTARLVVSLEARLTRFEKALQRAEALADGSMGAIEKRAKQAEQRLASSMAQINLEHQLDVARAQGNNKVVEKLTEELALRKQIGRLISAGLSQEEARALAEKQIAAQTAAQKLNEGFSGAVRSTIGRARLGVIEEGGAKIGLYGSALEKLGLAGVAAGAGVLIAAEAMERAEKAAEWAEDLEKVSQKLGVTTSALQELDYVALKSGVSQETLREGLQKVQQAIGAYTSNVKDTRVKTIFEALGISKDAARDFDGPVDGLTKIADAVAKVGDRSQQLSLLKQLKVPDDMVPLLLQGGDAIRDQAREARELGLVMDHEMVERGAKFAEQLKISKDIISHEMMQAFIDMAPVVSAIVTLMSKMAQFAADTVDNLKTIHFDPKTGQLTETDDPTQFTTGHLERNLRGTDRQMADNMKSAIRDTFKLGSPLLDPGLRTVGDKLGSSAFYRAQKVHTETQAELEARRAKEKAEEPPRAPARALVSEKAPKQKAPPQDQTAAFDKTAIDAADSAARELAAAQLSLASSIDERARLQQAEITAGTDKKLADLSAEEAKIRKAKVDTHSKAQIALLEQAKADTASAAKAKAELSAREASVARIKELAETAAQAAGIRQDGLKRVEDYNTAMAGLASTTAERTRFERAALAAAQAREREAAQNDVAQSLSALTQAISGGKSAPEVARAAAASGAAADKLNALPQTQDLQTKAFNNQHLSPWDQWLKDGRDAAAGVHEALEKDAVSSIDEFNSKLLETRSIGASLSSVFKTMLGDLERYLLKQGEVRLFGGGQAGGQGGGGFFGTLLGAAGSLLNIPKLPGHATGADSFGGATKINERGTEGVAFLPPNTQIIPNDTLRGLARLDPSKMGRGAGTMNHNVTIDLAGANGDETIKRIAGQAAGAAYRQAMADSGMQMQDAFAQASFQQTYNSAR